jgi:hypothetical protein
MAFVKNYNKNIHDLYLYDSDPVIDWQNQEFSWANPIAFNPNLYIKNISQYAPGATPLPEMDFSGVVARVRGVSIYTENINEEMRPWTEYFNGMQSTVVPYVGNAPLGNYELKFKLLQDGWNNQYWNIVNDYNHWNTGDVPACLISPMHVLIGGHMFDPLMNPAAINLAFDGQFGSVGTPTIVLKFIGKNNVVYTKKAKLKFFLNNSDGTECYNAGVAGVSYNPSFCQNAENNLNYTFPQESQGKDLAVLEFVVDDGIFLTPDYFTPEELQHIKIYKIANGRTWPSGSPLFQITPNGAVIVYRKQSSLPNNTVANAFYIPVENYPNIPTRGVVNLDGNGGKTEQYEPAVFWYGDSCNFVYAYYPPTQETVFIVSHGQQLFDFQNYTNYDTEFLSRLKSWIYERTLQYTGIGYNISWLDYSNAEEALIINQEPYPLLQTLPENSTSTTISNISTNTDYTVAVSAFNDRGLSSAAGPIQINQLGV